MDTVEFDDEIVVIEDAVIVAVDDQKGSVVFHHVPQLPNAVPGSRKCGSLRWIDVGVAYEGEDVAASAPNKSLRPRYGCGVRERHPYRRGNALQRRNA